MKQEHVNLDVNGPKRTVYKCCLVSDQQHLQKVIRKTNRANKFSPMRFAIVSNAKLGAIKLKVIVDTGASISILPTSAVNGITLNPTPISLFTANREKIKCYGQASLEIGIPSLRRSFTWTFVITDITNPLLGLDFLNNFGLIVD